MDTFYNCKYLKSMFSKAYELVSEYTSFVVAFIRFFDGTVEASIGTFIILNSDGWIVTAKHILNPGLAYQVHQKKINDYLNKKKQIEDDKSLKYKEKGKKLRHLKKDDKWITHYIYQWGKFGNCIKHFEFNNELDIAIGKMENVDLSSIKNYPIIINPSKMKLATSLCKMGFPFYKLDATFNENEKKFVITNKNQTSFPRFPVEGIYTRNVLGKKTSDGNFDIKFIETSSPSLKGQSGGPIFDKDGNIWGVNLSTNSLFTGFRPKIYIDGEEKEENLFYNVGIGLHAEILIEFLNFHNVSYDLST